jgi:threonine dehydrogenase-like Zn-dependent dehydrogenase
VENFSTGLWVTVAPLLTCGVCEDCKSEREYLCSQRVIFGNQVDGALTEYLNMPSGTLFPVPDSITPLEATLTEPLAVAVHAVNRVMHLLRGANILISGSGAIGLLIAQILVTQDVGEIVLLDIDEDRLNLARTLGFKAQQPSDVVPSSAQIHFIVTGSPGAIKDTPNLLAFQGTTVIVGILEDTPINWTELLLKEGTITTSRYFTRNEFKKSLSMLGDGSVRASPLIEDTVSFYDLFSDGGKTVMQRAINAVRLVVEF